MAILTLGIALRSLYINDTFTLFGVEFFGTDSYYHVHQTVETDRIFPKIPEWDRFVNYPEGQRGFPGGFEYVTVLFAKMFGFSKNTSSIRAISALMPLFWFLAGFICIFLISGRSYFLDYSGNKYAKRILGVFLFAILPVSIFHTSIGKYDHHILETIFLLLSLLMTIKLFNKPSFRLAVIFGLIFGLMPLFWVQSTLFLGLFALTGAIYGKRFFALSCLVASIIYFLLAIFLGNLKSFDPNVITAAQGILGMLAVFLVFLGVLARKKYVVLSYGLLALVFALIILFTNLKHSVVGILTLVSSSVLMIGARPTESLSFDFENFVNMHIDYSLLVVVLIMIPFVIVALKRKELESSALKISVIFLACTLLLFFLQIRFETLFLGLYIILLPEIILLSLAYLKKEISSIKIRYAASLLLILLLFPFKVFNLESISNSKIHPGFVPFRNACLFLHKRTEGADRSKMGVLTKWDYGHWVIYYCGMPTVTSPLSDPYLKTSKIFYLTDMETVRAELRAKKVKYIMSILPSENFQTFAQGLGIKEKFMTFKNGSWFYERDIFKTLNGRLSFLRWDLIPGWMKIIYISPESITVDNKKLPIVVVAEVNP